MIFLVGVAAVAALSRDNPPPSRTQLTDELGPGELGAPADIPAAYLDVEGTETGRQEGILLSSHWLAADGSVTDSVPDGEVVGWPEPLVAHDSASRFRIWLDVDEPPLLVELRIFDGDLDSYGAPVKAGEQVSCAEINRGPERCTWGLSDGAIEVWSEIPPFEGTMLIVLYAQWYLPPSGQSLAASSSPVSTASWGFRMALTSRRFRPALMTGS